MVWAEDPETGERALKRVVRTFLNEKDELVHVQVNGETITCTTEHPFYVQGKGWIAAKDLKPDYRLVLQNGRDVSVDAIWREKLAEPTAVNNFEVEDFHTYYVGIDCVLVHNQCVVGEKRPDSVPHNGNEIYKQVNNKNQLVSMAIYDEYAHCVRRIDYIGRPHCGALPHVHVFGYNSEGYRNYSATYDMTGKRLPK